MQKEALIFLEEDHGLFRGVAATVVVNADELLPFGRGVGRLGTRKKGIRSWGRGLRVKRRGGEKGPEEEKQKPKRASALVVHGRNDSGIRGVAYEEVRPE